jgi:hypothetical protein
MADFGKVTITIADAPVVVAALEKADRLITLKDAALMAWLEREHPDEGSRVACPDSICQQALAAINAERKWEERWPS